MKTPAQIRLEEIDRELAEKAAATAKLARQRERIAALIAEAEDLDFDIMPKIKSADSIIAPKSMSDLIASFKNSAASAYQALTYASKRHYDSILRKIDDDHGRAVLSEITADDLRDWHHAWSTGGKVSSAFAKIGMVRGICGFGIEVLGDGECGRLYATLSKMKFESPKARNEHLTEDQANRIRAKAHEIGRHSIALAQAFQFGTPLRQKDVVGEWVPISEPGVSDVIRKKLKWLRGIRWDAIDENLILTHTAGPGQKPITIDLKTCPMVMEELELVKAAHGGTLPKRGAVVAAERQKLPWNVVEFRRQWRKLADACGVPKNVRNMDSRASRADDLQDDEEGETRVAK